MRGSWGGVSVFGVRVWVPGSGKLREPRQGEFGKLGLHHLPVPSPEPPSP